MTINLTWYLIDFGTFNLSYKNTEICTTLCWLKQEIKLSVILGQFCVLFVIAVSDILLYYQYLVNIILSNNTQLEQIYPYIRVEGWNYYYTS